MQIFLDRRATRLVQQSAADAIEDGDTETLRDDVINAFREEQVDEIERRIDGSDFYEFIGEVVEEWDGDDVTDFFELLEAHLSEVGIELKLRLTPGADDDDDDEDDDDDDAADELEDDDEDDLDDDDDLGEVGPEDA